jgi:hypothetical protein
VKIVKVYAGEKLIAEYPDCSIAFSDQDREIYVIAAGVPWGHRNTKYVCCFPKLCKNLSVICETQGDTI